MAVQTEAYAAQLERNKEWKRRNRSTLRGGLQQLLATSKFNATKTANGVEREREWDLSLELLLTLWEEQGGRCALTGREMTNIRGRGHTGRVDSNVSIDRIDPTQGYVPGNVQLVCAVANRMKTNLSQADFVAMCREVIQIADGA